MTVKKIKDQLMGLSITELNEVLDMVSAIKTLKAKAALNRCFSRVKGQGSRAKGQGSRTSCQGLGVKGRGLRVDGFALRL